MSFGYQDRGKRHVGPEVDGERAFTWDGLSGTVTSGRDDWEQPETLFVIGGEEGEPATVAISGTSGDLAASSLRQISAELRV